MKEHACNVRNWTEWRQDIEAFVESSDDTESDSFNDFDEDDVSDEDDFLDEEERDENSEERANQEAIRNFIEACNSYAESKKYDKIMEICNQCLDPNAPQVQNFIKDFNHWFVTVEDGRFIVDFAGLQEVFKAQYEHWFIDYEGRCIYTLDGGDKYYIGFETLYSDERKTEWLHHLSFKPWSTPEMITELSGILKDSYYISLTSQLP